MRGMIRRLALVLFLLGCTKSERPEPPSILLVTLDTTRADSIGPGNPKGISTPAFNALAARARQFRQAYATVPQTLPSHASMLTGLYPAGHGLHENARYLGEQHPLVAEKLRAAGYRTAAFVSAFPVARQFGLARGFDVYDDQFAEERSSRETTDRALAWLRGETQRPVFLWVHYFDPHYPYTPSYGGEIAAMDAQLGRLLAVWDGAVIVAGDHGESLGEHGEAQHGNLVYQGAMHVPLLVAGPGVTPAAIDTPVSIRRVFHTILDFAGLGAENSLRGEAKEVVLGEGMIPFLQYGWQPQVMAVEGRRKVIHAGTLEVYDVVADPQETHDLGATADLSREVRQSLREYPIPSPAAAAPANISEEERRRLASLGYVAAETKPVVRKDAPRPRDMTHLFATLDQASELFVREEYAKAIPLLERILAADPHNLTTALRLAAAHSALGHDAQALAAFRRAEQIAPDSPDVRHYLALHYARGPEWQRAVPLLERVVAESPDRLPAVEALAVIRERQGRLDEALRLWRKVLATKTGTPVEHARVGRLAMELGQIDVAIDAFTKAGGHDLELGVLYLAARRFAEARDALDRVPPSHPGYAMALFKRAQVSVLLGEPDRAERIARARAHADATTRELIERERLFK